MSVCGTDTEWPLPGAFLGDRPACSGARWLLGHIYWTVQKGEVPSAWQLIAATGGGGILTSLSIGYAFRPHLRIRLTLGGLTFPRKPWVCGEGDSNPYYRYSCRHSHLYAVHRSLRYGFGPAYSALLPLGLSRRKAANPQLRQRTSDPFILGAEKLDQ